MSYTDVALTYLMKSKFDLVKACHNLRNQFEMHVQPSSKPYPVIIFHAQL